MKKIVTIGLLTVSFVILSCKIWDEVDTAGNQKCIKYDQALDVSFATSSIVDSIHFFINGKQVCIPNDYSIFRENRGIQGFQGRFYNRQKIFACEVGAICDNFDGALSEYSINIYFLNQVDSIHLTRDGLAQLNYNKAYRIFKKLDSALIYNVDKSFYTYLGCQGEYCIAELSSDSLLCLDAQSETKIFERDCSGWSGLVY